MKKLILLISVFLSAQYLAQEKPLNLNCYNKWSAKFEARGADEVKDGVYDDVIITNRQGPKAVCLNGKVEVRNGLVTRFFVLLDDGSYEEFKRNWKNNSNENVNIINGISASMLSVQGELINILWPAKIKPKKARPIAAAEPTDD
jgi:hypothetical protein